MARTTVLPIGTRFGRLVTTGPVELRPRNDGRNRAHVPLRCDCGRKTDAMVTNLRTGNTTSCGCYHLEAASQANTTHGATAGIHRNDRPRLYRIWRGMRERCGNPNARNYKWYGGKGISICPEWQDFETFRVWAVTHGYANGLELDREHSERDYNPVNCRWVTKKQNLRSRDHLWSDELDAKLIAFANARGLSPYSVIATAVAEYIEEVSM